MVSAADGLESYSFRLLESPGCPGGVTQAPALSRRQFPSTAHEAGHEPVVE